MKVRALHAWDLSPTEAIGLQRELAKRVRLRGRLGSLRWVAGCDVAYDLSRSILFGGAVLWDLTRSAPVERALVQAPIRFPYIPGLLSFREAPVLLHALSTLKGQPQVVLVDGHGVAHPRGLGLASHLGLHLDAPTVGCAKGLLVGDHEPLGAERGTLAWLHFRGIRVGAAVRTRTGVKPLYVSPGQGIGLEDAVKAVLLCLGRFRIPEPLRQAHIAAEGEKCGGRFLASVRGVD